MISELFLKVNEEIEVTGGEKNKIRVSQEDVRLVTDMITGDFDSRLPTLPVLFKRDEAAATNKLYGIMGRGKDYKMMSSGKDDLGRYSMFR